MATANKKIKKINIGDVVYDIYDAATAQRATENVSSINGYSYSEVNNGEVQFANDPITEGEIEALVQSLSSTSPEAEGEVENPESN